MLADPQSVTIASVTSSLPRLEARPETNVYSSLTDFVDEFVTQKVDKQGRRRATISLTKSVIVTDALTGVKSRVPYSATVGFSYPIGVSATDVEALWTGLNTQLTASTNALLKKIIGGER